MSFVHDPIIYNINSAQKIVPILLEFLHPHSVVDVGCGIGTWLSVFQDLGVRDILGIDGEYVNKDLLYSHIDKSQFISHDLTKPLTINRKFDLVISLEVAEHLPKESSDHFVETLISLGDYIIFSAAIPNQNGDGHINEQWPTYWSDKFQKYGFNMQDCIRYIFWSNTDVNWWYKQNIFLVVKNGIEPSIITSSTNALNIVHPELYQHKINHIKQLDQNLNDLYLGKTSIKNALNILLKTINHKVNLY